MSCLAIAHSGRFALVAVAAVLAALPALAAEGRPTLRADVSVESEIVTIGDLFENPGARAATPLFRAPDLGRSGSVSADIVVASATAAGLADIERTGIVQVSVVRPSRTIGVPEIGETVKSAVATTLGLDPHRLDLSFDTAPEAANAAPRSARPLEITSLTVGADRRFAVTLTVDQGNAKLRLRFTGSATEMADVITPNRALARGDVVGEGDLVAVRLPARQVVAGAATGMAELVGLAARRSLPAGQALNPADFAPPILINRGDLVHIVYRSGSLTLSADGRALASGAKGGTISIMNLSSNRVIDGVVTGGGAVEVRSNASRFIAGNG